jgi:hypothetical protein
VQLPISAQLIIWLKSMYSSVLGHHIRKIQNLKLPDHRTDTTIWKVVEINYPSQAVPPGRLLYLLNPMHGQPWHWQSCHKI